MCGSLLGSDQHGATRNFSRDLLLMLDAVLYPKTLTKVRLSQDMRVQITLSTVIDAFHYLV